MRLSYLAYISLSIVLAYVAIDIYLPAMPMMCRDFGVSVAVLQNSLTVYLLGVTAAQLVFAPIIDSFGYRRLAFISTILFIVASLLCAAANTIWLLYCARFFQAVTAGVIALIARASLPRLYAADYMAKIFMIIGPLMSLSPALAPAIGGYLSFYYSWQSIFLFLVLIAVILLVLVYYCQHLQAIENVSHSLHPWRVIKTYISIVRYKPYLGYLFVTGSFFFTYFAFLSESPFILHNLGYRANAIGLFYIALAVGFTISSQISRVVINYVTTHRMIMTGFFFNLLGIIFLLLVGIFIAGSAYLIMAAMMVYILGNAFAISVAMAQATAYFPARAGYAASLISALNMAFAALAGGVIHFLSAATTWRLAIVMLVACLAGMITYFYCRDSRGSGPGTS